MIIHSLPDYDKIDGGVSILDKIKIGKLRDECRHFSDWIDKLEQL